MDSDEGLEIVVSPLQLGCHSGRSLVGADANAAKKVGIAVDIAVPLAAGFVGAARAEPDLLRTDVLSEALLGAPSMSDYPQLETLMGGWFHQDFDINGDSLAEIIAAYRGVTPVDQQSALATEIKRFLAEAGDVDSEFQRRFRPDVSPTGFAPTTRQFLTNIASLLDGA